MMVSMDPQFIKKEIDDDGFYGPSVYQERNRGWWFLWTLSLTSLKKQRMVVSMDPQFNKKEIEDDGFYGPSVYQERNRG